MNAAARIGPNAITRVAEALILGGGPGLAQQVFDRAGLAAYLREPPGHMVDEVEVTRLHAELRGLLGVPAAAAVAREAGRRTAAYLLAHRIPRPVQSVLRGLPPLLAARVLLHAVRRHAWTFSGSGRFEARPGRPVVLTLRDNPLCRGQRADVPVCDFYAATFEGLFRALVHPATRVDEVACEARGDAECRFELRWP
jgi:divinyl protochlorophyllide a 8-vinyl-reductase